MTTLAAPRRTSPTAHTVRQLADALLVMGAWFWGIALAAVVVGNLVGWLVADGTDVSIAIYARQGAMWFPFSLGIMLVAAYLRVHVAAGMTRRTFVRATLLVEVGAGVAYAAVLTALVLAERAVHDALGWESAITEIQLTDESSAAWAMCLELAVTFVVANLSGLLVGVTYQRLGGWWGTLALPLTVGPLVVTQYVGGARFVDLPGIWTTTEAGTLALGVVVGLVLAVAMGTVYAVLTRRLQLAPNP